MSADEIVAIRLAADALDDTLATLDRDAVKRDALDIASGPKVIRVLDNIDVLLSALRSAGLAASLPAVTCAQDQLFIFSMNDEPRVESDELSELDDSLSYAGALGIRVSRAVDPTSAWRLCACEDFND